MSAGVGARGRPRSERAHTAILEAAGELMLSGGLRAATVDRIAARAGVSKATVYRWWPSRGAVALDGFLRQVEDTIQVPNGATTHDALVHQLRALVRLLRDTPSGPLLRALTAQAESDPEVAAGLRDQWLAPRRAATVAILERAVADGELRADADISVALDQLLAPVYHRLQYGHEPLTDDLPELLVTQLMRGLSLEPQGDPRCAVVGAPSVSG
jgi:AcrR family transcriptional regulator